MNNLTKLNSDGQVVVTGCSKSTCDYRHCYDCALVSHEDMFEIMKKLNRYENTGLIFEE